MDIEGVAFRDDASVDTSRSKCVTKSMASSRAASLYLLAIIQVARSFYEIRTPCLLEGAAITAGWLIANI